MTTSQEAVGSPLKNGTSNSQQPSLRVESGYLVVNDELKLRIDDDMVRVPDEQWGGLIENIEISQLPLDLALRFMWETGSDYPMNGFRLIDMRRTGEDSIKVELTAGYFVEIGGHPISVSAWRVILFAAAKIGFEGDEDLIEIDDNLDDNDIRFKVTIRGEGKTAGEILYNAVGTILEIENRARAFHFVVAQERSGFGAF